MTVFAHVDTLPQPVNQRKVVEYFATRPEGALSFSQPTLSRKIRHRPEIEARVDSHPNVLSTNRPRIVTRPDVYHKLWQRIQDRAHEQEAVNRSTLIPKREEGEEDLNVPEEKRLPGEPGWVQSSCRA